MTVRQTASTTMLWVKEFSTNIFLRFGRGLFNISFFQRNRKQISLCLLIWVVGCLAGYGILRSAVKGLKDDFYQVGMEQTRNLVAQIGPSLLENDVLSLNMAIGELESSAGLIFAAIVDHQDKIVAHTDSRLVNRALPPLGRQSYQATIKGVSVEEGVSVKNEKTARFSSHVVYSGVKIGKVYLALSAADLYDSVGRDRTVFVFGVVFGLVLLSAILVTMDRLAVARALKAEKALEGMTRMGPYLLEKKVAQGGMAELFVAGYERQDGFRKTLAVKRVLPHLAANSDFVNMFIREARLAALLQHPNVVQVIDFGKIQNVYFIAMEYVRGKNLGEIMATLKEGMTVDQAVFVASQVAMGLEYSHSKKDDKSGEALNIVHRDISPQNILISFQGEVKISDFGISKTSSEPSLTHSGVIKGKLAYLSPEQALGQTVDHQADLYALGIVFYEILSGKRLYKFTSDIEAIRTIPEKEIAPIKDCRQDIPDELNRIVMKCLEKDKRLRYQSARELRQDLTALRQGLSARYDRVNLSDFMRRHFQARNNAPEN
ncbi:MAG: serine/threonine-protein kinase [Deltaproteobacteria bacterium]